MYCILDKITCVEDKVIFSQIGYLEDMELCNSINQDYDNTLGSWVELNILELESGSKTMSDFFNTTSIVYVSRTYATSIDGFELITEKPV